MASDMAQTDPTESVTEGTAVPALEIAGLSHGFGKKTVLHGVDMTVPAGGFTVLLGPNGAGKTTLYSLITRLYDRREGDIRVFGEDVSARPGPAMRRLGVVFQQRTLDMDLTVRQNLKYHGALHGMDGAQVRRRADAALERVSLADRKADKVRTLSGGQMRRLEIARSLMHGPRLLLLDEPTVGLDIESRQDVISHVRQLCADEDIGVLWATHLIDEVGPEDRVIVLHQGRVQAEGPVAEVVRASGEADIGAAFRRLTTGGGKGAPGSAAPDGPAADIPAGASA